MSFNPTKTPTTFEKRCLEIIEVAPKLARYCLMNINNWNISKEDAEDLSQTTIRKTLDKIKNGDIDTRGRSIMAYLISSCKKNLYTLSHQKTYCNRVRRNEISTNLTDKDSENPIEHRLYQIDKHPLNAFVFMQFKEVMDCVLSNRDLLDQAIWSLYTENYFSNNQIAAFFGISFNTCNSKILRLRKLIQDELKKEGLSLAHFNMSSNDDVPRNGFLVNEGVQMYSERISARRKRRVNA
jgi:DNA-directed RNA polymerase specialized sigma24 family protein